MRGGAGAAALLLAAAAVSAVPVRPGTRAAAPAASLAHDINIVHVTDVHSWLSGHLHEPANEADYPDVLALFQHLEARAHAQGRDIFLFNSGDIVDGTGLAGATAVDGAALTPIIRQMPFAALTCGNHELYINSTVENLVQSGFIDSWRGLYVQGNIRNATTDALLGAPFAHIKGALGTELVVLGFLYNMADACGTVRVEDVAAAIQRPWFAQAMQAASSPSVQAIVVLAHMHFEDPLVAVIRKAIRKANVGKPLILLTGHSHIRAYAVLDPWAVTMESGKYLDTVGLLGCSSSAAGLACDHEFVTPHRPTFYNLTATSAATFQTPASRAMRTDVRKLRRELGLDQVIGCSAREYRVWAPVDAPDSLWRLFVQQIAPAELPLPAQKHLVFVGSTGSFRWNLYQGPVSLDDTYVVNPFKDPFVAARTVPGPVLAAALAAVLHKKVDMSSEGLRTADMAWLNGELPAYLSSVAPEDLDPRVDYDLVWFAFDTPVMQAALAKANGGVAVPVSSFRQGDIDSRSVFESFIRREWPCLSRGASPGQLSE